MRDDFAVDTFEVRRSVSSVCLSRLAFLSFSLTPVMITN